MARDRLTNTTENTSSGPLKVTNIAGEELEVLTPAEQRWFNSSRDMYLSQTKFTETTDLRDLDRLIVMELMVYRLGHFISAGHDYDDFDIDDTLLRRNLREYSEQINKTKSSMGLNKSARDDAANAGDLSSYIANLKMRAKIFGIHREQQLMKALVLMQELSAVVGAYDRSDAEERGRLGFETDKDILDWVRNRMLPEYHEIDAHFRENNQRYWVREM